MSLRAFRNPVFIGLETVIVFTTPVLKRCASFLLKQTLIWTFVNIFFHVTGGLGLAMFSTATCAAGDYRTILILPWAIPQVIAVLAWRGEFNYTYGYINVPAADFGVAAHPVDDQPRGELLLAMCITNIWLGIPFMMVTLLGGLQHQRRILRGRGYGYASGCEVQEHHPAPAAARAHPGRASGHLWTFNNFNVPFFINQNELETSDIPVTGLFRAAFQYNRYGFAAAFAFVIFALLLVFTIFYMRYTKTLQGGAQS